VFLRDLRGCNNALAQQMDFLREHYDMADDRKNLGMKGEGIAAS